MSGELCKACFKTSETEVVQIMEGGRSAPVRKWIDSGIRCCANPECRNTTGGTLAERLAHIDDVYGYKYFGDYELAPEQLDAVWEAKAIAFKVPALVEALRDLRSHAVTLLQNSEGCAVNHYGEDFSLFGMPGWLADARAAVERATDAIAPFQAPVSDPSTPLKQEQGHG